MIELTGLEVPLSETLSSALFIAIVFYAIALTYISIIDLPFFKASPAVGTVGGGVVPTADGAHALIKGRTERVGVFYVGASHA
ncbi:hypothetical protein K6Y31_20885 [Motilimonas cestriensis]|uniref:Uncharacterized protein n=1 Tax=Motilimonas cestriensis TaxID=2742685 RepID=A0ABS8WFZ4_9GAMM|nr:hypothetical protein [Motilimonas cestriensis]MCE2597233.1 hypothetical protein [Motilimonas cestriensis]